MTSWYESTELLLATCAFLDARTLAKLSRVCSFIPEHLRDPKSVRFVASLRGALRADLSTLEQFALADAITALQTAIKFPFREVRLEESSVEPLLRFAEVMVRHPSFTLSVEAHCGLEAPRMMGFAFARERAESVKAVL
eukprot:CAMPEP_0119288968 /NCGR_PEP_ID=MMETSP1329-20130426/38170_1 /TAXON_ID=114041 /ORGANISM="Genus nov. species nov., Strain RCC1024" /LENGTH=138 /DNA_ID=CAMNT_0007289751 /DNA_START=132 /DNA_END=545 /DNA_ORIENTATION=+